MAEYTLYWARWRLLQDVKAAQRELWKREAYSGRKVPTTAHLTAADGDTLVQSGGPHGRDSQPPPLVSCRPQYAAK